MSRNLSLVFRRLTPRRRNLRVYGSDSQRTTHANATPVVRRAGTISSLQSTGCSQLKFHFSTGANPEDLSTIVQEILQAPVGSLDDTVGWANVLPVVDNFFLRNNDAQDPVYIFELLDRLVEELDLASTPEEPISQNDLHSLLNAATYHWRNNYIEALDKSSLPLKPSGLVQKIRAWNKRCDLQVDTDIYTMILEAAASNAKDPQEGVQFAESLLEWMVQEAKENQHFMVQPSTTSVAVVMKAWVDSGSDEACGRVEAWLDSLHSLHDEGWLHVKPNVVVYNIFLHALAEAKNIKRAEQVLQSMLQAKIHVDPDHISFSTVLLAYTKQETFEAMANAVTLLDQMLELFESGMDSAKPNVVSFTTVMNGFAKLGQPQEAERLLHMLMGRYEETLEHDWKPDTTAFNTVMNAWSMAGQPDRANDLLQQVIEQCTVEPNDRSFHAVLSGWAKAGNPEQAEALLHQMHKLYTIGVHESSPTVLTYNIVLDSWANSRRRDAWQRACDILHHMEELHRAGDQDIRPNVRTWNTIFNCFTHCGPGEFHQAFKLLDEFFLAASEGRVDDGPNLRTWNTLLAVCVYNTKDDYRVRHIWKLMKTHDCDPDIITYNTIFSCYARYAMHDMNALSGFEEFLAAMQKEDELVPTKVTYRALVDAWITFGLVQKAENVLSEFCKASSMSDILIVDLELFHRVLLAWSDLKKPRRVESLVLLMEELHGHERFENLKPGVDTYNTLLHAWARSNEKQSGERANLILREMGTRGVAPNLISYNCALNAWASSGDAIACAKIESLILEMILQGKPELIPDEVSYNTWMKAILLGDEARKARRVKELLKTMKIHNFEPNDYILNAVKNPIDGGKAPP
jgi:pentatricopeptide repeat protein